MVSTKDDYLLTALATVKATDGLEKGFHDVLYKYCKKINSKLKDLDKKRDFLIATRLHIADVDDFLHGE